MRVGTGGKLPLQPTIKQFGTLELPNLSPARRSRAAIQRDRSGTNVTNAPDDLYTTIQFTKGFKSPASRSKASRRGRR